MRLSKEQLLTINGLKLSGIVDKMDDNQLDEYCEKLEGFIETFSVQETELKKLFSAKKYDAFFMLLATLKDMLEKIQAINLANSSRRLLDEISGQKYKIAEAHLSYLLAEISELSIELQIIRQKNKLTNIPAAQTSFPEKNRPHTEGEPKSILAVDDVPLSLNVLKINLQDTNYKLTGVKSGMDALRFIRNNNPDLFILDIEMPEMDGYELAKKIRSSGQTAPIIFLTGNAKPEYVIKAIEVGAADFLVKPVNKEHMLEKIRKYI